MVINGDYKNTDIGIIPKDWDCIHLCSLGQLLSGLTYTPEDVRDYGLLVLRSSNIQEGRLSFKDNVYVNCKIEDDKYVKQGDLLICVRNGSRALIGKCALIDRNYNATFGAFMALFRSQHGKYLYQLFSNNAIQEQINRNCSATINQITSADFNRFLIAFPRNPKEQADISEALSDVDSLLFSLQKLIEKKKAIKQGAMQELLIGKKRLPGFYGEWSYKPLGILGDLSREVINPQSFSETIFYEYSMPAYDNGRHPEKALGGSMHSSRLKIYGEVILFNKLNVRQRRVWYVEECMENAICSSEFLPYHPIKILPEFLYQVLLCDKTTVDFENMSTGTSNSQKRIAPSDFLEYKIFLPEKDEQQAIAQVLSDMDSEIELLEKKLAKYQQIKQGMMQELLTGRIRLVSADGKEQPKTQVLQEKQAQPAHNQHFDDAVMIAGIVNAFYSEKYPLGRKKVQKLLYLVRRKEQADISAFHKKAAGPYADEIRYKGGEPIAQKNKYIQIKRNERGSCFEKGVQMQQALTYLQDWGKQADVDWLVSQFQYTSVNELELLATVDMAICDLRQEDKEISVASIKDLIRSNKEWRGKLKKAYFKDADIQRAIKHCQELFPDKEG